MCGIAGVVSKNNIVYYADKVDNALDSIKHRGPDDKKIYKDDHICFGYVRLAIRGMNKLYEQPIEKEQFVAFGNGEVYFRNGENVSDKENDLLPLIQDLIKHKDKIYKMYDADFAVACYNKKNNTFLISRDLFGIKPLYYTWLDDGSLAFASEIKALKVIMSNECTFQEETLLDYLIFGYPINNKSFYKEIYCLPPGNIMEWDLINNKIINYSYKKENIKIYEDEYDNKDIYLPLKKSLEGRLISDRKVGFHLSGGKDSSLIAYFNSILQHCVDNDFFSVFNTEEDNDLKYSKLVSEQLNIKLHMISLPSQKNYEEIIKILDSPIMSTGALVPYEIAKYSKEHRQIVLIAGQGADELFLGYSRFKELKYCLNKKEAFKILANSDFNLLKMLFPKINFDNILKTKYFMYFENEHNYLENGQKFYIKNFLTELLHIEDHVHMHFGLENRVPYLSLPVYNWLVKNGICWNESKSKVAVENTHKKLNTILLNRKIKENMNINLNIELHRNIEKIRETFNTKIFVGLDYDYLVYCLNNILTLSKKEVFTIWALYNITLWYELNGFKSKIDFQNL